MDRKFFNYKRELKQLFASSAQQYGARFVEEDKEERKGGADNYGNNYEGASKKMQRRIKLAQKQMDKNKISIVKKYLLVQPNPEWPKAERLLTMEQVRTDKKTG